MPINILHKLKTAAALSGAEKRLWIRAWFLLLAVDLGLRTLPFKRVQAWLACSVRGVPLTPEQTEQILRSTARMVALAARYHLYPITCLRRALVLQRLLAQQGIATELRFGVRKEAGELKAHAWVEWQGVAVGDAIHSDYARLSMFHGSMKHL